MESQVIELIGRNHLVNQLLRAGIEVALPLRDRGIDLIAYVDIDDAVNQFLAVPIQLKAASRRSFGIARKYDKFPNLVIAYVWNLRTDAATVTYALTQPEAVAVADVMGYTKTASWREGGGYTNTKPSQKLITALEPYRMTPERWREKLLHDGGTSP